MRKKEMHQLTLENFFNDDVEYTVEELGKLLRYYNPIFGELKIELKENNSEKSIVFVDEEIVSIVMDGKTGQTVELEEPEDMSSVIMVIYIDDEGRVKSISNGISGFFTWANKEFALFTASLINKKIKL